MFFVPAYKNPTRCSTLDSVPRQSLDPQRFNGTNLGKAPIRLQVYRIPRSTSPHGAKVFFWRGNGVFGGGGLIGVHPLGVRKDVRVLY